MILLSASLVQRDVDLTKSKTEGLFVPEILRLMQLITAYVTNRKNKTPTELTVGVLFREIRLFRLFVNELDNAHFRSITATCTCLNNTAIAAVYILVFRSNLIKKLLNNVFFSNVC